MALFLPLGLGSYLGKSNGRGERKGLFNKKEQTVQNSWQNGRSTSLHCGATARHNVVCSGAEEREERVGGGRELRHVDKQKSMLLDLFSLQYRHGN